MVYKLLIVKVNNLFKIELILHNVHCCKNHSGSVREFDLMTHPPPHPTPPSRLIS
jgi:hypothetical protein